MRIKGSKKAKLNISNRVIRLSNKALADPKLANRLKNRITLAIRKNSLLPSGKSPSKISSAWKRYRAQLSSSNKTDRFFNKNGSNFTFTGQFLRSFVAKISNLKRSVFLTIGPSGKHRGYNLVKGGTGSSVDNASIGKGFIERGDDYTVLSNETKKQLNKSIKARVIKELKLNL